MTGSKISKIKEVKYIFKKEDLLPTLKVEQIIQSVFMNSIKANSLIYAVSCKKSRNIALYGRQINDISNMLPNFNLKSTGVKNYYIAEPKSQSIKPAVKTQ
jgi:hypothetical protein